MKAFLIDCDYITREGKAVIRLIMKRNRFLRIYDSRFEPYFYANPRDGNMDALKAAVSRIITSDGREAIKAERLETEDKLLFGKKVTLLKIFCRHPSHVRILREHVRRLADVYEADIVFPRRYLIDGGLVPYDFLEFAREGKELREILSRGESEGLKLNTLAFDIETYNPLGLPRPDKDPVIMISHADEESGVLTYKSIPLPFVTALQDEKSAIDAFCRIIKEKDIELLIGYNDVEFDLPYLRDRAKKVGAELRLGRDGSTFKVQQRGLFKHARIKGRIHLDLYAVAKFLGLIGALKTRRLTLGEVYSEMFGEEKKKVRKLDIWRLWDGGEEELKTLAEYSLHDAIATKKIADKVLPLEFALARLTGASLQDVCGATTGQLVEMLLWREAHAQNRIVPNKPDKDEVRQRESMPVQGAYVKLPEAGIYSNLAVFDFKSMYPSIILSHNVDMDSLNCGCCDDGVAHVSPTGARFCAKRKNLIPSVLERLMDERDKAKKELKALKPETPEYEAAYAKSQALKILSNSVAPDEPVVLMSPDKQIVQTSIGQFVDQFIAGERVGDTQLGDAGGWKAACFLGGKVIFRPIRKVMRHRLKGELIHLRLGSGRAVKITEDHSVFTLNDACNIVPIEGCKLKRGDVVLVPKRIEIPSRGPSSVDLLKSLTTAPEEETNGLVVSVKLAYPADVLAGLRRTLQALSLVPSSLTKLSRALSVERRTATRYLRILDTIGAVALSNGFYELTKNGARDLTFLSEFLPKLHYEGNSRRHHAAFNEVRRALVTVNDGFFRDVVIGADNGFKMKPKLETNRTLARFLGYYVSEGHSRKWINQTGGYSYQVGLTNHNPAIFDEMFDLACSLGFNPSRSRRQVLINSQMAYLLVRYVLQAGGSAGEKQVPPIVFTLPKNLRQEFLETYYLGDGTFHPKSKQYKFTTKSEALVRSLTLLLHSLGIGATTLRFDSGVYRILVSQDIFERIQRQRKRAFVFTVPGHYIKEQIMRLGDINYYFAKKYRIDKERLTAFYKVYRARFGSDAKVERLLALLDSDLSLEPVVAVDEASERPKYVYDLSVEEAENFIGGRGLVCLHNSFYGFLLYARSRWYSRPCGESVTAYGRHYIQETMRKAEAAGFKVLYGDTDSLILQLNGKSKAEASQFMRGINSELPERMELELEGFYPRGVFVGKKLAGTKTAVVGAKKKYALIGEDGRIKIRGFELVRRDWSRVARHTQQKVLEAILKDGSKEKAAQIVKDVITDLREGRTKIEDCIIYSSIRKDLRNYAITSPEVAAAQKAIKAGIPVQVGSLVGYVVTKKGRTISEKSEPAELAKDYDSAYYIDHQVLPAVLKIMKELGYSEEDLKGQGKQTTLFGE